MTPQEIFDKVCKHLLTQRVKSINGTKCVYRGPNGTKCAVGCLIPDELYKPAIESCTVHKLICDTALLGYTKQQEAELAKLGFTDDNAVLMAELQAIHDGDEVAAWPHKLAILGARYGLNTEALSHA